MICNDSVPAGINTGDDRRAVYHGRTGIDGMMIAKSDSLARQLPKGWRILFGNEIRTHPVPDHDNDVARLIRGLRSGRKSAKPACNCKSYRELQQSNDAAGG